MMRFVFLIAHLRFYCFIFLAQLVIIYRMTLYVINLVRPNQGRLARHLKLGHEIGVLVQSFFQRLLGDHFFCYQIVTQSFPGFRAIRLSLKGARLHDEFEAGLRNCHPVYLGEG
jgi:hypothetical protein